MKLTKKKIVCEVTLEKLKMCETDKGEHFTHDNAHLKLHECSV